MKGKMPPKGMPPKGMPMKGGMGKEMPMSDAEMARMMAKGKAGKKGK